MASSEHQEAELSLQCGVRPWGIKTGTLAGSGERSGRRNGYLVPRILPDLGPV